MDEPVLHNPLRAQLRGFLIGSHLCAGVGIVGLALPGTVAKVVTATIALTLAFVGYFTAFVLRFSARRVDAQLAELAAGEHLARWTYSAQELRAYAESRYQRGRFIAWVSGATVSVLLVSLALGILLGAEASADALGLAVLSSLALGAVVGLLVARRARARRDAMQFEDRAVVLIGPSGAYVAGDYHMWDVFGTTLGAAEVLDEQPPVLAITIRTQSGQTSGEQTVRVPIPAGQVAAARDVARRLTSSG